MFNFGRYSAMISAVMDTDYIDIRRDIAGALTEVYSNIPCHISYSSTDNPDPTTVDVKPVITSLVVNMGNWVDVENDDFIVAKKMGADGDLQSVYSGRCGEPTVSQGRKKISVAMRGTEAETPTPPPPKEYVEITLRYFADDGDGREEIQDAVSVKAAANEPYSATAREIEGYVFERALIDGKPAEGDTAYIENVGEVPHGIEFEYSRRGEAEWLRFLCKGMYTKDSGAMANGWHLYKRIRVYSVAESDGEYIVTCDGARVVHEETMETLGFNAGRELVLIPGFIYLKVESSASDGGRITFSAREFEPTEAQREAYVCGYYDD